MWGDQISVVGDIIHTLVLNNDINEQEESLSVLQAEGSTQLGVAGL